MESVQTQTLTTEVKKGQVFRKPNGKKAVAARDHTAPEPVEIIAEYPHEDGDLSYMCGSDYCRCMS